MSCIIAECDLFPRLEFGLCVLLSLENNEFKVKRLGVRFDVELVQMEDQFVCPD